VMAFALPEPTTHARQAVIFALLSFSAIHCGLGALMAGHGLWRLKQGYVSAKRQTEMVLAWLWNGYAAATLVPALGLVMLLATAGGGR
jgi:cytochrome c oxidase subunit I+III